MDQNLMSTHARPVVFDAVVEAAWADGVVTVAELAAARAVADSLGLRKATLSRHAPRTAFTDERRKLAKRDREMAVAAAAWMALMDEHVQPAERVAVRRLSEALGVSERRRLTIAEVAYRLRASRPRAIPLPREFSMLMSAIARLE